MKPDILYATTDDGIDLPIVDVTHPAFTVSATEAELHAGFEKFLVDSKQWRERMTPQAQEALKNSMIGRGIAAAAGTFLAGMDTYLFKLGPENLGAAASPVDLRIAASFAGFVMRLRLQDMARLLADGLAPILAAGPHRPLSFINIAGGPAADSWNTLIHLRREHPDLLADREVAIAVLDRDQHGPAFGARAVARLGAEGAPLGGLQIVFEPLRYDWTEAGRLEAILRDLHCMDSVCAISSEGGLFEYGSDEEIVANLESLHTGTPPDAIVVGSVTRGAEGARGIQNSIGPAVRPRTFEVFQSLAKQARWAVQSIVTRPFSFNLRLVKGSRSFD